MIYLISHSNLELLDKAVTGLERALTKTTLGLSWDIPSLYGAVKEGSVLAFYQVDSGYSGVLSIHQTPKMKSLYWWWSGKDPENKTPIDFEEVDLFLVAAAKQLQCQQILGEGRKGWERVGGPMGYKEDTRLYSKEVTYELPQI